MSDTTHTTNANVPYTKCSLKISDNQKAKIKRAMNAKKPVTIRITETGDDILALTNTQINKINKAFEKNTGVDITLSKKQIKYNLKIEGGFLGMLAGLAASFLPKLASVILPALGVGAAQELAATAVKKIVGNGQSPPFHNGLYLKKGGCICKIEHDGHGIYLDPNISGSGLKSYGDGFYLRDDSGVRKIVGNGLLDNIPIIGPLLHSLFGI